MADDDEAPFLKAIRMTSQSSAGDTSSNAADHKPRSAPKSRDAGGPLRQRQKRGGENLKFSHSVSKRAVDGFYQIALDQDWTMNKTLTAAFDALEKSLKKDKD